MELLSLITRKSRKGSSDSSSDSPDFKPRKEEKELEEKEINANIDLNIKPSRSLLKTKLKNAYQLELLIAKQNNSLDIHNAKWKAMLPFISFHFFCL